MHERGLPHAAVAGHQKRASLGVGHPIGQGDRGFSPTHEERFLRTGEGLVDEAKVWAEGKVHQRSTFR